MLHAADTEMIAAKRRPLCPLFLAAIAVLLLLAAVWRSLDRRRATVTAPAELTPARVCVTQLGMCPVGLVRRGDPCTCPDTLYGNVPGQVESVRGTPEPVDTRKWPARDVEDPLEGLGPLVGP